jgi:hypothetical protein
MGGGVGVEEAQDGVEKKAGGGGWRSGRVRREGLEGLCQRVASIAKGAQVDL